MSNHEALKKALKETAIDKGTFCAQEKEDYAYFIDVLSDLIIKYKEHL